MTNYNEIEIEVINNINWIINETLKIWFNVGSQDWTKVDFLHHKLRELLLNFINTDKYDIIIEWKIPWHLKPKDCDLVIVNKETFYADDGKTIEDLHSEKKWKTLILSWAEEVISVKNPLSSYSKNKSNYFEAVIWEAINLKLVGVKYTQFLFISDEIPKYKNDGEWKKLLHWMDYIWTEEIEIFKKLKELKVEGVNILDDFVTFLYHVNRYDKEFQYKEDLINEEPSVNLHTEKIPEIWYSLYLFEYLSEFSSNYQ